MATQNKCPSGKFDNLRALDGDRDAVEAVCRQHWPKEGAIRTTARRESALACAIVVLRALLATVPPNRRAPPGNHPLLDAACVLDAEESMRLADIATQPETNQPDFQAIMESPAFLERSFWMNPLGELFYVEPQPFGPVSRAQARDIQMTNRQWECLYAAKGMLIIEPSNSGDNPATLHDAVQLAYNKVLADAPPRASSGCWCAPQFIRLQYDGRMGFDKLCFDLDVAQRYDTEDGDVLSCPPRKWFYECIAAVCLSSEIHTVTLWDRICQVQVGPPSPSPWWVGENDNASLVGDGIYMLYFTRYEEHGPHVVIQPPTTISEHVAPLADDHHPVDSPAAKLLRFLTRGGLQDHLAKALQAAEDEDISALLGALEAARDEIQYSQDKLKLLQIARANQKVVANSPADELDGQLSDASTEIASWESYSPTREREYVEQPSDVEEAIWPEASDEWPEQPSDVWEAGWPTQKWDELTGQYIDRSTEISPSEAKSPNKERDELVGQLNDVSTKSDGQLSVASTEIAASEDPTEEREDMLIGQLRDADREIADLKAEVKHLQLKLSTEQLIHDGVVDVILKTHGDTVRILQNSIRDALRCKNEAKED